ncbi:MAG: GNAT family protein [Rickettsiaceae bacterium]|nr:GNAT family protein [Rickettsiaceae bacterium]
MISGFPYFYLENGFKLRQIDPYNDSKFFREYITDEEVSAFIAEDSVPKNIDAAIAELSYWGGLYNTGRGYYWAIANENNEIIGTAGFNSISFQHMRGEISYDLSRKYWGKGVMSMALSQILNFAFLTLELVRVQATVGKDNMRSIFLLERLNFIREGSLAKYEKLQNKHLDFYMYAITRNL